MATAYIDLPVMVRVSDFWPVWLDFFGVLNRATSIPNYWGST